MMMKKLTALLCVLFLLTGVTCAGAEVFIDAEKPADWESRDLLRLTVFKFYANDAMLLECGGETMLVDGGVKSYADSLAEALTGMGCSEVDWFFNTHPHNDHVGAQTKLLANDLIGTKAFLSLFPEDYANAEQRKVVAQLKAKGIPYVKKEHGDEMTLGGAQLKLYQWIKGGDPNGRSAVMLVTFGQATLLLTGDVSGEGQNWLAANLPEGALKADVLKLPHHGLVRMPPAFAEAVSPEFTVITNTRKATANARKQLEYRNIQYMNNNLGRITLETDGVDWYVVQEKDRL